MWRPTWASPTFPLLVRHFTLPNTLPPALRSISHVTTGWEVSPRPSEMCLVSIRCLVGGGGRDHSAAGGGRQGGTPGWWERPGGCLRDQREPITEDRQKWQLERWGKAENTNVLSFHGDTLGLVNKEISSLLGLALSEPELNHKNSQITYL